MMLNGHLYLLMILPIFCTGYGQNKEFESGFLNFVDLKSVEKYDAVHYYQPEQIHLSYGENLSSIVVTWSTKNLTSESIVEYGINGLVKSARGCSKLFVDGGPLKRSQYIHRVTLTGLKPNAIYVYHCGSNLGWSAEFWFKAPCPDPTYSPHLAIYGDMGNINAQSLPRLQQETQRGLYDAILHVGDFAYDMNFEDGEVGDEFMRQIEPIAAYLPYMTVPGNHEEKYNFSHYKARFSMPGKQENMFYSFNLGPAHFIGFSTEAYYFLGYGIKSLILQYEWLERDLVEANKPENRAKRPWIITFGHRPMYCSNSDKDDCTYHSTLVRIGLPILQCGYGPRTSGKTQAPKTTNRRPKRLQHILQLDQTTPKTLKKKPGTPSSSSETCSSCGYPTTTPSTTLSGYNPRIFKPKPKPGGRVGSASKTNTSWILCPIGAEDGSDEENEFHDASEDSDDSFMDDFTPF